MIDTVEKEGTLPYLSTLAPFLQQVVEVSFLTVTEDVDRKFQAACIDAFTAVLVAVGLDAAHPYLARFTQTLKSLEQLVVPINAPDPALASSPQSTGTSGAQPTAKPRRTNSLEDDDPRVEALRSSWLRLAHLLKEQFIPLLDVAIPPLLRTARQRIDLSAHVVMPSDSQPSATNAIKFSLSIKTQLEGGVEKSLEENALQDRTEAFESLEVYADELGSAFLPYVPQCVQLGIDVLSNEKDTFAPATHAASLIATMVKVTSDAHHEIQQYTKGTTGSGLNSPPLSSASNATPFGSPLFSPNVAANTSLPDRLTSPPLASGSLQGSTPSASKPLAFSPSLLSFTPPQLVNYAFPAFVKGYAALDDGESREEQQSLIQHLVSCLTNCFSRFHSHTAKAPGISVGSDENSKDNLVPANPNEAAPVADVASICLPQIFGFVHEQIERVREARRKKVEESLLDAEEDGALHTGQAPKLTAARINAQEGGGVSEQLAESVLEVMASLIDELTTVVLVCVDIFGAALLPHMGPLVGLVDSMLIFTPPAVAPPSDFNPAILLMADIIFKLGSTGFALLPKYMPMFVYYAKIKDPMGRQNACYALGIFAERAPNTVFEPYAKDVLATLVIAANLPVETGEEDGEDVDSSEATAHENAVSSIGKALKNQTQVLAKLPPSQSPIGKYTESSPSSSLLDDCKKLWYDSLPLLHDTAEAVVQHEYLLSLIDAKDPIVLGPLNADGTPRSAADMFGLFAKLIQIVNSDFVGKEANEKVTILLRSLKGMLPNDAIGKMLAVLPEKRTEKLKGLF